MNFREMTKQQLAEESLINLTYALLEEKKSSIPFNDLIETLKEITGLSSTQLKTRLIQFYTDLNVDGRFLFNQETGWGLREWYKVEQIEEETAPSVKTHKKKSKAVLEDDEDDLDIEEDEIGFDEDYEEFVEEDIDDEKDENDEDLDFDDSEDIEEIDEDIDEEIIEDDDFELDEEEEEEE